jgi:hypothetical protein
MLDKNFVPLLRNCCLCKKADLFEFLETTMEFERHERKGRVFYFKPGITSDSPMVVCHADTVCGGGNGPHNWEFDEATNTANSIALDDRLGIAAMIWLLSGDTVLNGFAYLICDDEEIGQSTASLFDLDVYPNWMVELDRRGDDVVCYDYESPIFSALLESSGFRIGKGSFSDISSLDFLEVVGFNMGVGYHNEHSEKCHAKLDDLSAQLLRLVDFSLRFSDMRLPYEPPRRYSFPTKGYYNSADKLRADDLWHDVDPLDIDEDEDELYNAQKRKSPLDFDDDMDYQLYNEGLNEDGEIDF